MPSAASTEQAPWHGTAHPRCWAHGWDPAELQQPPGTQTDGIPAPTYYNVGGPAPGHCGEGVKPGKAEV